VARDGNTSSFILVTQWYTNTELYAEGREMEGATRRFVPRGG